MNQKNQTAANQGKYTGFDRFKYDVNGVSRYHHSKLRNGFQLDLEHRIKTGQINLFVTLNPNIQDISIERLTKMVKQWEYLVQSRVLRCKQRDSIGKYVAFGFIEDGSTHETRHIHLLIQVSNDRIEWIERMAYKICKKVCKSGSVNVQRVDRSTSKELSHYVLKDIDYIPDDYPNFDKKALDRLYV